MTEITTCRLGATDLNLTRVGLGAWAIGGPRGEWGWGPQADDQSIATIHAAVSRGINWVDTAAIYGIGHAETVIGRALAALPAADRPYVFTKCGMTYDAASGHTARVGDRAALRADAENSLRRLGVSALDLLQLHWPPLDGTPVTEAWAALVEMRTEGLTRWAGVSNCDAATLEQLEPVGHVDTVQPPLSLLVPDALSSVLPWCADHGAGVIVYSPMYSGLLTGKYDAAGVAALDPGDWRLRDPQFTEPRLSANIALVAELRAVAQAAGCTLAELVVAWTLHQPGVSAAIVGARAPQQIGEWIGAAALKLGDDALASINAAVARHSAPDAGAP